MTIIYHCKQLNASCRVMFEHIIPRLKATETSSSAELFFQSVLTKDIVDVILINMMKFLRKYALWSILTASLPLALIAAVVLCVSAVPAPKKTVERISNAAVCRTQLPLVPAQEEKPDASALLQNGVRGALPAALVSRRNGERPNCRLPRDGNAALIPAAGLQLAAAFTCTKIDFAAVERQILFKHSIPPRAGPAVV